MSNKTVLSTLLIFLAFSRFSVAPAATLHVDIGVDMSGDGESWETAFKTIQEGVDFALDGDTVIVAAGAYLENIHFMGQNIILRSTEPTDPVVVASTIIDGNEAGSVVTFSGSEDESCVLSGFTIRNGKAERGGGICGGAWDNHTHATIQNNVITANQGAGLCQCNGTIQHNTISGNSADGPGLGGGLYRCEGTIRNNLITGNSAGLRGGGLYGCDGVIHNNTVVSNSAGAHGGGLSDCAGTILNCIIWGNAAPDGPQLYDSAEPNYCCVQEWLGPGKGNILQHPFFVNPDGDDYHLFEPSPCIDSGLNQDWMRDAVDLDGKPRILLGSSSMRVDMGAYEYGSFAFEITHLVKDVGGLAELTWASRPGDIYTVGSRADPSATKWIKEGTVPSQGERTSWTDLYATSTYKLYRIELESYPTRR